MAVLLVFIMLPVTAFTYSNEASAEPLDSSGIEELNEGSVYGVSDVSGAASKDDPNSTGDSTGIGSSS